jgi:hypothetical protein
MKHFQPVFKGLYYGALIMFFILSPNIKQVADHLAKQLLWIYFDYGVTTYFFSVIGFGLLVGQIFGKFLTWLVPLYPIFTGLDWVEF